MDIYVGNLPYTASEEEVRDTFAEFGNVDRVKIVIDRDTGRSKGFAFVTMTDGTEAQNAIDNVNGALIGGRPVKVNEARPREPRPGGGGGGGGGGRRDFRGGGGGGGGGGRRRF